jgi:hypothetical protein
MEDDNAHYWHPDHPFPPPGLSTIVFPWIQSDIWECQLIFAKQGCKEHLQRVTARTPEIKSPCYMPEISCSGVLIKESDLSFLVTGPATQVRVVNKSP